jgi:multiple sugar transport system substrate-binding protein
MSKFTRREVLKSSAGVALGAAVATPAMIYAARAWAEEAPWKPENGAELRLLRWKRFVQSEGEAFAAAVDAFSKATGVKVRVDSEGFEDLRPKSAVAASIGSGPDIVWTIHADPHLYPDKLIELTDVAEYLGGKYDGWYPISEFYSKRGDQWISVPFVFSGNYLNYRVAAVQKAGFETVPDNTDDFLKLMQNSSS